MARISGKNTQPEIMVRRILHALGSRFRLHRRDLPGCPDVVLPSRHLAIFVHGCFWHRHDGCKMSTIPKTRREFWAAKFAANVARDHRNIQVLKAIGWRAEVIWECETREPDLLKGKLAKLIGQPRGRTSGRANN